MFLATMRILLTLTPKPPCSPLYYKLGRRQFGFPVDIEIFDHGALMLLLGTSSQPCWFSEQTLEVTTMLLWESRP